MNTPETDHLENELGSAAKFSHPVIWRHARQLERERDEAREAAHSFRSSYYASSGKNKAGCAFPWEAQ